MSPLLLAGMPHLGVDLIAAIKASDLIGILCIIVLVAISIRSGYYMFAKFWEIRSAEKQSEEFIEECLESNKSLSEIYRSARQFPNSPLASLFREAYVQYEMEVRTETLESLAPDQRIQFGKASVESALERTIAAETRKLENKLVTLATASTLAPFIGLLGTVWGILGCFQALGSAGSADLATLAPGVSTALVATVFGLLVAIPASAVHNYLSASVGHLSSQMDSFSHELSSVFQKHFLRREAA